MQVQEIEEVDEIGTEQKGLEMWCAGNVEKRDTCKETVHTKLWITKVMT